MYLMQFYNSNEIFKLHIHGCFMYFQADTIWWKKSASMGRMDREQMIGEAFIMMHGEKWQQALVKLVEVYHIYSTTYIGQR